MKAEKLIISAVGPYAEKMPEIDFGKYENKGLVLITGDTGAGKTYIFDSIAYALYGVTSGMYRDTKNLRSEYAKPETESYVEFSFSHQGRAYRVYRKPAYDRPSQRGSGIVTEKEKAFLYIEGEKPIEGITAVNKAIIDLLQVDYKQFKQIAMISQGEFWNLLNAKTEARTEILRNIFMTDKYNEIEEILKHYESEAKGRLEELKRSCIQYFSDVSYDEENELSYKLNEFKKEINRSKDIYNFDEFLEILGPIIDTDKKMHNEISKELSKLESELEETKISIKTAEVNNGFLEKCDKLEGEYATIQESKPDMMKLEEELRNQKMAAHEINPVYSAFQNTQNGITRINSQLLEKRLTAEEKQKEQTSLNESYKRIKEKGKDADAFRRHSDKISNDIDKYRERDALKDKYEILNEKMKNIYEKEKDVELSEKELIEKITVLKKSMSDLKNKPQEKANAYAEINVLMGLYKDAREVLKEYDSEKSKRTDALQKSKEEYGLRLDEYESASKELIHAEKVMESNRAGILAKNLKEGQKCPVCGSIHHPELAEMAEETVTEEEFKTKKSEKDEAERKKNDARASYEAGKGALEEFEEQTIKNARDCLKKIGGDLPPNDNDTKILLDCLEEKTDGLSREIDEKKKLIVDLEQKCLELKKMEEKLYKAEEEETKEIKCIRKNVQEVKQKTEADFVNVKARLQMINELEYADYSTAFREMEAAVDKADRIYEEIKNAADKKNDAERDIVKIEAEIESLESQLTDMKKEAECKKTELEEKLNEKNFKSLEEMLLFNVSEDVIEENEKKLNDFRENESATKSRLQQAREDAKGKKYIDVKELGYLRDEQTKRCKEIRDREVSVASRLNNNIDKKRKISEQGAGLEKLRKQYSVCSRMYKLVNGNSGNGKITLEQYIQAAGFDGIIAAANRRLRPMSDGRYELYRKKEGLGKKTNTFLDLEVLDNYTGCRRPVGNLSGGESFKASLSLALGLSDTVSSNLGGIQMDALFIDEGFGTLDRSSIESAMEVLVNLSGTNKLVCVVSHRDELKENISQKIHVVKTHKGSRIELETDV